MRLLKLLDDTPVVPGDVRPAYEGGAQARQILNDAEDDLRDWQPEPDGGDELSAAGTEQSDPSPGRHRRSNKGREKYSEDSTAGSPSVGGEAKSVGTNGSEAVALAT